MEITDKVTNCNGLQPARDISDGPSPMASNLLPIASNLDAMAQLNSGGLQPTSDGLLLPERDSSRSANCSTGIWRSSKEQLWCTSSVGF